MAEPTFTNTITGERIPITGSVMPDGSISTAQLADGAVTAVKLSATALALSSISAGNIPDALITNAKLANMSAGTVKGRLITTNTGVPTDLSPDQQIINFTQTGAGGSSSSGNRFGVITYIASDGVMEIGQKLDFHLTDNETLDYAVRVGATGTTGLVLNDNVVFGRFLLTANSVPAAGLTDIVVTISGTFDNYYIQMNITPVVDNSSPVMRYVQGGNSVANTSSYTWGYTFGIVSSGTAADNCIHLGLQIGSVESSEYEALNMTIMRPNAATRSKVCTFVGAAVNGAGALGPMNGGGFLLSNSAAIEAVLIFIASAATVTVRNGSIKSGHYWVYGDMGGV